MLYAAGIWNASVSFCHVMVRNKNLARSLTLSSYASKPDQPARPHIQRALRSRIIITANSS